MSSAICRLRSAFSRTAKPSSAIIRHKPTRKTSIPGSSQGLQIESLVDEFKKSSDIASFRRGINNYEATVRRLSNAQQFSAIKEILEHQKKYPDIKKEAFVVRLIGLYGKAKMLDEARKLFDEMPSLNCERTVLSFNALLAACINANNYEQVNELFKELPEKLSIEPDTVSYNTVIKALCDMDSLDSAVFIMNEMEKNNIMPDLVTFNTLLESFYRNKRITEAAELWSLMEKKNVVANVRSYNSRLRGFVRDNRVSDAVEMIEEIKNKGLEPDSYSYNALIKGYIEAGNFEEAKRWHGVMTENGCTPDWVTFGMLIPSACDNEDFDYAYQLCQESLRMDRMLHSSAIKMVIDGLTERKKNEEVTKLMKMAKV